jgi:hypothetical protein
MPALAALPFLTEADPDRLGEGSLDPLGLASIADHLADLIAPSVTARMSRVRFLTAIAVGATMAEEFGDEPAADGRTTPYLAYEWLVVEALARKRSRAETEGVPGILKARRALNRSWGAHLDAGSYLQVPKVFGFHGVYKRLARAASQVDDALVLLRGGDELVRVWEREQRFPGFMDRTARTPGGRLAGSLLKEVSSALRKGRITTGSGSHVWSKLAWALGPDDPGRRERRMLWRALVDEGEPIRRELVIGLRDLADWQTEAQALRALAPAVSPDLRFRLSAIDAYERVARLLVGVFRAMQIASTGQGTRPVSPGQLRDNELVNRACAELPDALARAVDRLDPLGEGQKLQATLGHFAERYPEEELVEAVLEHHERVQAAKGGKRPWLERAGPGFYVRDAYRTSDDPAGTEDYVHPYRVWALSSFITDLRGGR